MKRRSFLTNGLMAAAWGSRPKIASSAAKPASAISSSSLKGVGTRCGIKIGLQTERGPLQSPDFAQIVKDNFNLVTPGNELKWPRLRPSSDSFDFTDGDWMVNFCQSNGLLVHGHNLCWNSPTANPNWFKSTLNKSNANRYLTEHITTVMRHYAGRIDSWDVVNEAVVPWPGRSDGLYPGIWLDLLGPEYIDVAFHAAALADPNALRVINLHHVEQGRADDRLNHGRALALLTRLVTRGVPVQAVGLESHLDTSLPFGGEPYREFVREIAALKLQVLITEMDVKETRVGDSRNWDETVAQYYENYLTEVLSSAKPSSIIFWSLKDRWENGRRIQGLMQNSLTPRRSYSAVLQALHNRC